jgi:hypothetical protein
MRLIRIILVRSLGLHGLRAVDADGFADGYVCPALHKFHLDS